MMSRSFFKKDELQIQNVELYLDPLQNLTFFVENVSFPESLFAESKYKQCKKGLYSALKKYGSKIILAWKRLVQRMNAQNIGITQVHIGFLYAIINHNLFKEALSVIDKQILPKIVQPEKYMFYLSLCSQIYASMHKFKQAYSCIHQAFQIQCQNIELCLMTLKGYIFLSKLVGKPVSKMQFNMYIQKMKLLIGYENKQILQKNQKVLQAFTQFLQNKILSQTSESILERQKLFWVTKMSTKTDLKKYISQLGENTFRIKASQVKGQSLSTFQNIKDINRFEQTYKYDCKNGVIYFNNKVSNQQKINKMISQSCNMQKEILNHEKQPKLGRQKSGMSRMMGMMM